MDTKMNNLTLNQEENRTSLKISCTGPYLVTKIAIDVITCLISIPITAIVIVVLLRSKYKTRKKNGSSSGFSPAENFLLHVNIINICDCLAILLYLLDTVGICKVSSLILLVLHSLNVNAEPMFLIGICMTIYLAVVQPVVYMNGKTLHRLKWMYSTLAWLYAFTMLMVGIIFRLSPFTPAGMLSYYITLPTIMFFTISTLKELRSSRANNGGKNLNTTKRRAFRIILGILLVTMGFCTPQVCFFTYRAIVPTEWLRYWCVEAQLVLIVPTLCKVAIPGIYLHSLSKLGI